MGTTVVVIAIISLGILVALFSNLTKSKKQTKEEHTKPYNANDTKEHGKNQIKPQSKEQTITLTELRGRDSARPLLTSEEQIKFDNMIIYVKNDIAMAENRITKLLLKHDVHKAMDVVVDILANTDKQVFAVERHFFLLGVIDKLYAMRDVFPESVNFCLGLCEIDLRDLHYFMEETGHRDVYAVSPTRAAIILEKKGNLEEAIEICDKAIKLGVLDSNHQPFTVRKEKLKAKLAKHKAKNTK